MIGTCTKKQQRKNVMSFLLFTFVQARTGVEAAVLENIEQIRAGVEAAVLANQKPTDVDRTQNATSKCWYAIKPETTAFNL